MRERTSLAFLLDAAREGGGAQRLRSIARAGSAAAPGAEGPGRWDRASGGRRRMAGTTRRLMVMPRPLRGVRGPAGAVAVGVPAEVYTAHYIVVGWQGNSRTATTRTGRHSKQQ